MRMTTTLAAMLGVCFMTGCAAERHASIPADASLMSKGQGDTALTAPNDGMVYVYDYSGGDMVYSGRVRRGDNLNVDVEDDSVNLNGRSVMGKQIRDLHELRVFFKEEPLAAREANMVIQRETVRPVERDRDRDAKVVIERKDGDAESTVSIDGNRDSNAKVTIEGQGDDAKIVVEPGKETDAREGADEGGTTIKIKE